MKPQRMELQSDHIPYEPKNLPQWVLWNWEQRENKWTEPPYCPSGTPAKSNDPKTWFPFPDVVRAYESGKWDGIGFMLAPPFVGVDLDNCIDPKGLPRDWASAILKQMESYTETSPSGRGYKIVCKGTIGKGRHNAKLGVSQSNRYSLGVTNL